MTPATITTIARADGGGEDFTPVFKKKKSSESSERRIIRRTERTKKKTTERKSRRKIERKVRRTVKKRQPPVRNAARTTRPAVRNATRSVVRRIERAPSGLPPQSETRFKKDEVIVRFQRSSSSRSRDRLIRRTGLIHIEAKTFFLAGLTVHRYALPENLSVREAINVLERDRTVVNVQPNYLYELQQSSEIPKLKQFANERLGVAVAHEKTRGKGTRIAIIDTLIDKNHSELAGSIFEIFDVSDGQSPNNDPHGTSVAGIIAANKKLTGIAPEAEIIGIAAFSKDASGKATGNTWTIMEALNVALNENAKVLNLSFAGPADPLMKKSFEGATRRKMVSIAAAGNAGPEADILYPAGYDTVFAITATDSNDSIYRNANSGEHIDFSAPGVGILVLGNKSGFKTSSGTSMATAYVSGIAALVLSVDQDTGIDALKSKLTSSAADLGDPGRDSTFGIGIIDAASAVQALTN